MSKIFYYDGESRSNDIRSWDKILPKPDRLRWNGTRLVGGDPKYGDVIVCHREDKLIRAELDKLAVNGVYVVGVAGNDRERVLPEGNTYHRAKRVESPVDASFSACFKYFLRHLQANLVPKWHLLEGAPPPDALLAYHLLDLFPDDVNAAKRAELRQEAMGEMEAIAGATGRQFISIDDRRQRLGFLRACS